MKTLKNFNTKVLISGAGQLGSRYLQGLMACTIPLQIYVQDVQQRSLAQARLRWEEIGGAETWHNVFFHMTLNDIPSHLDIVIVATNASVRPQVVAEIVSRSEVQYWILEKILSQSEAGLEEIIAQIGPGGRAWVNTPRRMLPWHQQIKSQLSTGRPMTLKVDGGSWGLACNSIHFLDMFAWWTGETLVEVNTEHLDSQWFEGKRPGNWEVFGTLNAKFSGGSSASLTAREGLVFYSIVLDDGKHTWSIDEEGGTARRSDGLDIPGRLPFQSEVTAALVESILEHHSCELPTLAESTEIHRPFIRSLLDHWKQSADSSAIAVPIT